MNTEERKKRIRRRKNLIGLLLAPVLFVAWIWWFELRTTFQPTTELDATGDEIGYAREEVWLDTPDETRLHAWYYPGRQETNGMVFLVCHGNAGNISHRLDLYQALLREGAAVFAFDYRGYGRSEGRPSEKGVYQDAETAYTWLMNRGYTGEQIVLFGESLGGGVASWLALQHPVAGLALMSTFTSAKDLGAELFPWLPVRTLARFSFDTNERLPMIDVPVLVLHSEEDTIIPIHHARQNLEAANEPKLFRELSGDHNDTFFADPATVNLGVRSLLRLIRDPSKEIAMDPDNTPNAPHAKEEGSP